MIQPNELRIGNWVNYGDTNKPYKIDLGDFVEIGMKEIDLSYFNPIPLTPEILEKAGFEYDQVTFFKNDIHIGEFKSGLFLHSTLNKVSPKITSVHQLQNLYFTLTGEELQIEL